MAITLDTGEPLDVHPREKAVIGYRLAQIALSKTYGQDLVDRGPFLSGSIKINKAQVTLKFNSAKGLRTSDGLSPKGFAIAGKDQVYHWADHAKIEGDQIIISSDQVLNPVAVRYAWVQFPELNLYNGAQLPMEPFRTDDWKLK